MGLAQRVLPAWLRAYDRSWLRLDALAGLTVLAYMVPQVLAYSGIVGLPPITGLTTAVVALMVYAWLGTSRVLSVGPEATVSLMAGLVLAPLIRAHPGQTVALTATLTLFVGLWLALGSLLKAGVVAQLLTRPILTGYLTGEALLMIASQLGHATRTRSIGDTVPQQIIDFVKHAGAVHWPTLWAMLATWALLLLLPRITSRAPAALTAVAVATLLSFLFHGSAHGLIELGALPQGLPPLTVPTLDPATVQTLLIAALGIALLAFSDVMLVARGFAEPGEEINANREMLAAGTMQVVSAFVGGYPSSASSSRTAIGRGTGQRSQLSGVVTAIGIALAVLVAGPLFEHLPIASLAAIVFWAAFKLVEIAQYKRLWAFRRSEFAVSVVAALGTAVLGILPGIGVAVALSALQILGSLARPHEAVEGYAVGLPGFHDVDDYANHVTIPGLLIYRYDGPLIAYNRHDFQVGLTRAVLTYDPRWVLLNVEANMLIDYSASETLRDLIVELQQQGRVVALARLKHDLRTQLQASGIMELIGDRAYATLPQAIRAYQLANPDVKMPPIPRPGEAFEPGEPQAGA